MITIFSTIKGDSSTCEVIDWLISLKANWQRINMESINSVDRLNISISNTNKNIQIKQTSYKIEFQPSTIIWFRRGKYALLNQKQKENSGQHTKLIEFQHLELDKLIDYSFAKFKNNYWLNHPDNSSVNKLMALEIASKYFSIPQTLVTNSKKDVIEFKTKFKNIIAKPINENQKFEIDEKIFLQYTEIVDDAFIDKLDDKIFPCLLQENVIKQFEIRSFYLDGEIYSMAIFSQKDNKTKTDFRQYNQEKQNRMVPYKMSAEEENLIVQFMEEMQLNSGSLDFIKSDKGETVFLEVNPVGQFGMVSKCCNYFLEEKIAQLLSKKQTFNG